MKRRSSDKKNRKSNFVKLSLFQPNRYRGIRKCPLSAKGAPVVDYKNIFLLIHIVFLL